MTDRSSAPRFTTTNPATGAAGPGYDGHTREQALDIARAVQRAHGPWSRTSVSERSALLRKVGALLRERAGACATLMTTEMGKTRKEGLAEIEKCAGHCDYFAEHAEAMLAPEPVDMDGARAFVAYRPLGVVLAVMPWNFPFWQLVRFAAPALMAGNTVVLKHASNVPGCAMAIEKVFRDAGLPADVLRTALIPSKDVQALIEDPAIAAVTLTGSVEAGRKVAAAAGAALKPSVLELGGSDPYVVLDDADIAAAAKVCATARMVNGGQSCIAGKRFIVTPKTRSAFETAFVAAMEGFAMGDPEDEATKLGPMQSVEARDALHEQVLASVKAGARLLTGGEKPARPGAWYPPTVLTDVRPGAPAYDEEIFGPIAAIIGAHDEADAIRIANDTTFGLGAGVLTRDLARGEKIAVEELHAGMAFVNAAVRSDSRLPFGGVRESGYGRESAKFGVRTFTNVKTVLVQG